MSNNGLTSNEKILLAAKRLEEVSQVFTAESLIVESWLSDKPSFGLKGYIESHPDSNRVLSALMGKRGLIARDWLNKLGPKTYRLGKTGKIAIGTIKQRSTVAPNVAKIGSEEKGLSKEQRQWLLQLFESDAATAPLELLPFTTARDFWGMVATTNDKKVDALLERTEAQLKQCSKILEQGGTTLPDGRWIEKSEVNTLLDRHRQLVVWFTRQLNIMRGKR